VPVAVGLLFGVRAWCGFGNLSAVGLCARAPRRRPGRWRTRGVGGERLWGPGQSVWGRHRGRSRPPWAWCRKGIAGGGPDVIGPPNQAPGPCHHPGGETCWNPLCLVEVPGRWVEPPARTKSGLRGDRKRPGYKLTKKTMVVSPFPSADQAMTTGPVLVRIVWRAAGKKERVCFVSRFKRPIRLMGRFSPGRRWPFFCLCFPST